MKRSIDEVLAILREAGHDKLAEAVRTAVRPAVGLRAVPSDDADLANGASKFGGRPDLPSGTPWPVGPNSPMAFLAQVDLGAACKHDGSGVLPKSGLLSFFYDLGAGRWGFDPADRGSFAVLYTPGGVELVRRDAPSEVRGQSRGYVDEGPFPCCRMEFSARTSIPTFESIATRDEQVEAEGKDDSIYELQSEVWEGQGESGSALHQMLGYPFTMQNPDIEAEAAAVSAGVNLGGTVPLDGAKLAEAEKQAADWVVLLQLDSDDDAGWMWGDAGLLYFLIRKDDLSKLNFADAWCILQCG